MTTETRLYAVDRIEGRGRAAQVTLIDEATGGVVQVEASQLGLPVAEGVMLRVPLRAGAPRWDQAVRDVAEEARLRTEMEARTRRLRRADPGGDLAL
ncbi:MAG: hypothetical protein ACO32Z_02845 [Gemmatimonadaceae bacterium]|jgi:hypothetical protein